ncbi:MAG: lysylphosphatidylglycerol synthase transmembrane domain-containing protein [Candidatus Nealsonbacteria bacterium]|nr:lysylphosphatidylglycerol synthase transmembrane domain-containing protein [Candidatus Nealsonbacteria bacterium]
MKKLLLFLVSLLIGLALSFWILETIGWQEIKKAFLVFTGWKGLVILILTFLSMLAGNWKWKEILKSRGVNVPFFELFKSYLAGFSLMFLAPIIFWGGELFRGYVLKEKNSVPWPKGMGSVIIDRILEWTTNLIIIFTGSIFFVFLVDFPPLNLLAIFGGSFLLIFIALGLFYFKCIKKESIIGFFLRNNKNQPFETEKEVFDFFDFKKSAIWKGLGISFLKSGITYLRAWVLILFLGKSFGPLESLSILGFSYLAATIPTPTSLGSHEAIQTFAFNSLGIGASTAAAFTMIIRGAELIFALAGIIFFFRLGIGLLKKSLLTKVSKVEDLIEENV